MVSETLKKNLSKIVNSKGDAKHRTKTRGLVESTRFDTILPVAKLSEWVGAGQA